MCLVDNDRIEDTFQYVGRVKAITRYPVKSMRGEALDQAQIGWHGIGGDRRYAFVKTGIPGGFPWLTGREVADMLRYMPRFADPIRIADSPIMVTTPAGCEVPLESPELLAELVSAWGSPAYLLHLNKGCHDSMPLSIISTASVRALGEEAGLPLDPRRFRPNVLVDLAGDTPFGEDGWIGMTIQFGEDGGGARIRVDRQNRRCAMTNIDLDSAERDPRVLKAIVKARNECAAVYASTEQPGFVRVGDPIYLDTGL